MFSDGMSKQDVEEFSRLTANAREDMEHETAIKILDLAVEVAPDHAMVSSLIGAIASMLEHNDTGGLALMGVAVLSSGIAQQVLGGLEA